MKKIILIFCFTYLCLSLSSQSNATSSKAATGVEWLLGVWKHRDKEAFEKWVKISDTEFKGLVYNLDAGYATITETMRIISKGPDDWYLESKSKESNNEPVLFRWSSDPVSALKFVNEKNEFPQIIDYRREAYDVMSASRSNLAGDKRIVIDYSRFKSE